MKSLIDLIREVRALKVEVNKNPKNDEECDVALVAEGYNRGIEAALGVLTKAERDKWEGFARRVFEE